MMRLLVSDRIPFVYFIKNKTTGMKYIGVKYSRNCHPDDLWNTYFTSSNSIHKLIKVYGKEDFVIKILHVFDNVEEALEREWKYVQIAIRRKDYLNLNHNRPASIIELSKRGKIGGYLQRDLKLGIHKQTVEERLILVEKARRIQMENGQNKLVHCDREVQVQRGKRGGPKNKGFIWCTDGMKNRKYTKREQGDKSLEEFLLENPKYRKGRVV